MFQELITSDTTAMLFHEVELLVRKVFNKGGKLKDTTNLRDEVKESVLQDECTVSLVHADNG